MYLFIEINELIGQNSLKVVAIRTDCIKLPFRIEVKTKTWAVWKVHIDGCRGPLIQCQIDYVTDIRLIWMSTDMHMLDGLSTARAGGGIHAEIVGFIQKDV